MIPFKELCEHLTLGQRYQWFDCPRSWFQYLFEDDYELISIDTIRVDQRDTLTVFYPAIKWFNELDRIDRYDKECSERIKVEKQLELDSKPKSNCCGAITHRYINKKLNMNTLVCTKCYKPCELK